MSRDQETWAHLELIESDPTYEKMFKQLARLETTAADAESKLRGLEAKFQEINENCTRDKRDWQIAYSRWRSAHDSYYSKLEKVEARRVILHSMVIARVRKAYKCA